MRIISTVMTVTLCVLFLCYITSACRRDRGADAAGHQAQRCVAQCVAMLVVKQGQQQVTATVTELLQMLKSADPGEDRGCP